MMYIYENMWFPWFVHDKFLGVHSKQIHEEQYNNFTESSKTAEYLSWTY